MRLRSQSTYEYQSEKTVDDKSRIVKKKYSRSKTKQQNNISIVKKAEQSDVVSIERLPDELLLHILSCLDVRTLYRCRRVSKRWHKWANQVKFSKLVLANYRYIFFGRELFPSDDHWFNTDIQIDYELDSIDQWTFHRLPFKSLQNLKRLKASTDMPLFNVYEPGKMVKLINKLTQLVSLEISGLKCRNTYTISLPSLMYLHFECGCSPRSEKRNITFNTPNLNCLRSDLIGVRFLNPLTIQVLALVGDRQDSSVDDFKNVEILKADVNLFRVHIWCFAKFPKMTELHLQISRTTNTYLRSCVNQFIELKIRLRKSDLKLYFLDTLLDDDSKRYSDYRFCKNYKRFVLLPNSFTDDSDSDSFSRSN